MSRFYCTIPLFLCSALVFTACESDEKRDVEKLTEEAQGSFPKTLRKSQELQKEVQQLNKEVKEESQQRIEKINRELERRKQQQ